MQRAHTRGIREGGSVLAAILDFRVQAYIDAVDFWNLARCLEIFEIELECEYCLLGTISILKSLLLYLLRLVCDFARGVYEVLAKLPFATALATWRVEFATCSGSVRSLRETS